MILTGDLTTIFRAIKTSYRFKKLWGKKILYLNLKKRLFALFENLLKRIKNDLIKFLLNINIVISEKNENEKENINEKSKKVGRNEKCPCGSGKKYKFCCKVVFNLNHLKSF